MSTGLEDVVTALFDDMSGAWNRADGPRFAELFTVDADFVEIRGGHHVGRTAIRTGHEELWGSIYVGSTVEYRVETVRKLGDRAGVGIVAATMTAPVGPLAGTNHSRITVVVTRDADQWRIASFHNTLVLPSSVA